MTNTEPTARAVEQAREIFTNDGLDFLYIEPETKVDYSGKEILALIDVIAAALDAARQEAEEAGAYNQFELDCMELCHHCANGDELIFDEGAHGGNHWTHRIKYSVAYGELMLCRAASLRAIWDARHPAAAALRAGEESER